MRSVQFVLVLLFLGAGCRTTQMRNPCATNEPTVCFVSDAYAYADKVEASVKIDVPAGWQCDIHEMHSFEESFRVKTPQESSRSLALGAGVYNICIEWLQSNALSLSSLPKPASILLQTDAGEKEHLSVSLRCIVEGFNITDVRKAGRLRYAIIYAKCVFRDTKELVPCYLVTFWNLPLMPTVEDVSRLEQKERAEASMDAEMFYENSGVSPEWR